MTSLVAPVPAIGSEAPASATISDPNAGDLPLNSSAEASAPASDTEATLPANQIEFSTSIGVNAAAAAPVGSTDVWDRIRANFALPEATTYLVTKHTEAFAREQEYVARIVERSRRYLYYIAEEVERRQMPAEIALLPIVESAFNPKAYSRSHASGIWQFIPSTGRHYGLDQNWWADGRRDIMAATNAALDYLQNLHLEFNDWFLAIAAYNCGEGTVRRAVARNSARGLATDFWNLSLPRETRNYVPKLLAVRNIVRQPEAYGLTLAAIPNEPYFAPVVTSRHIDVKRAAQFAEVSVEEFLELNPAYNRPVITAHTDQVILVPAEKADFFKANLENPDQPLISWKTYRLRRGMPLAKVAQNFGMSSSELKRVNGIHQSRQIAAGGTILVPVEAHEDEEAELHLMGRPEAEVAAPFSARQYHRVARGETLGAIAKRYRVSVRQLMAWNGLKSKRVARGKTLVVRSGTPRMRAHMRRASSTTAVSYTVRRGDTLHSIAQRFKVDVSDIRRWNRLRSNHSLTAGSRVTLYRAI